MNQHELNARPFEIIAKAMREQRDISLEISISEGQVCSISVSIPSSSGFSMGCVETLIPESKTHIDRNTLSYNDILERFKDIKPDEKPERRGRGGDGRKW